MNRNGMGPQNVGPFSGRGMGNCNKDEHPDIDPNAFNGRGMGRRMGRGTGMESRKGRYNGMPRGNGQSRDHEIYAVSENHRALILRIEALEAEIKDLKGNRS